MTPINDKGVTINLVSSSHLCDGDSIYSMGSPFGHNGTQGDILANPLPVASGPNTPSEVQQREVILKNKIILVIKNLLQIKAPLSL